MKFIKEEEYVLTFLQDPEEEIKGHHHPADLKDHMVQVVLKAEKGITAAGEKNQAEMKVRRVGNGRMLWKNQAAGKTKITKAEDSGKEVMTAKKEKEKRAISGQNSNQWF